MSAENCDYDVSGLPGDGCPECGRPVADHRSSDGSTWWVWLFYAAAAWPMVLTGWLLLMFVVARFQIGRWPVPSADDPKYIPIVGVMHELAALPIFSTPFVGVFLLLCLAKTWPTRLGVRLLVVLAGTFLFAAVVDHYTDVWEWYID